jgi:HlyD family secretion protein
MGAKKRGAIILGLLLLTAGLYLGYNRYYMDQSAAIEASGTIEATTVELTVKTAGTLQNLEVKEGDKAARGEQVAEISRPDLVAQRERDALAVAKAEAQLADITSGARAQEIQEAAASVNMARVNYDRARSDLERREILFQQGAISREEFERYQAGLETEKSKLQAAESRLSLLEAGARSQAIKAARIEVERSKAVLKATEAMLADLKLSSPISGVVLSRNFEPGEYVQPGTSLATVADLKHLWIKVYIPTDELPAIKLGQKARISVSGESRAFTGVVTDIASRGEFTPRTIQTKQERANVVFGVKLSIDNEDGILKPGMPADVVFERGTDGD